ncbi:hypothetical protein MK489_15635 [Myxococcota bacterium]|nr:hypothetical protein [Myxococcota bacterium]
MTVETWHSFYQGELQGLYAKLVIPLAFLVFWVWTRSRHKTELADDRFIATYCLIFAFETILDPIATGPLGKFAGLGENASTAVMLLFVLLGDLRVFWLVTYLTDPDRDLMASLRRAALWMWIVPIASWPLYQALLAWRPELPAQTLWILYEAAFVAVALVLRQRFVPSHLDPDSHGRHFLRTALAYVAVYYSLWLTADLLIIVGGLDMGWALRVVPNQLYYAIWVPFVYASWYARR